jgi:hypothetical protein
MRITTSPCPPKSHRSLSFHLKEGLCETFKIFNIGFPQFIVPVLGAFIKVYAPCNEAVQITLDWRLFRDVKPFSIVSDFAFCNLLARYGREVGNLAKTYEDKMKYGGVMDTFSHGKADIVNYELGEEGQGMRISH